MNKIVVIGLSGESIFLNVDHFNKPGETIVAKSKHTEPGGKGYNQALALGKIGADVHFITVLGNDPYKDECLRVLNENNVKCYPIYKNIPSSYAVIETDKTGENNVCLFKGASDEVTFDDILKYSDVFKDARFLLIQLEYNIETVEKIIDYAYSLGIKIILNPAPYQKLKKEVLNKVYAITPNMFEAQGLFGMQDIEKGMLESSIENIVVTNGANNLLVKTNGTINTIHIERALAVDTTGAGDIFNSFFTFFVANYDVLEASKLASRAASISVTRHGVVDAIPSLNEVLKK